MTPGEVPAACAQIRTPTRSRLIFTHVMSSSIDNKTQNLHRQCDIALSIANDLQARRLVMLRFWSTLIRNSHNVDKIPMIACLIYILALSWGRLASTYTILASGRTFRVSWLACWARRTNSARFCFLDLNATGQLPAPIILSWNIPLERFACWKSL